MATPAPAVDALSLPPDDEVEWTNTTSKNGVEFAYGMKKSDLAAAKARGDVPSGNTAPGAPQVRAWKGVNWEVQSDDNFRIITDAEFVRLIRIDKYKLVQQGWPSLYSYRLTVNTLEHGAYSFTDRTGDVYGLSAWVSGEHYVRYNSSNPTIRRVDRE